MDLLLPVWPVKSLVTLALFVLAVRLGLQLFDSLRLAVSPAKTPITALVVASVAELAKDEIADALGNDPEGDT